MKNMIKKSLALFLCSVIFCSCNAPLEKEVAPSESQSKAEISSSQKVEASETPSTIPSGKNAILVVSFGTSYNETREATIGAIEKKISENFSDLDVRRAFTSQIIINKLEKRDGLKIDNVTEAMDRLVADGVKKVAIQPTHVMSGKEYDEMKAATAPYEEKFEKITYGVPLLTSDEDYKKVAEILVADTKEFKNDDTAIVFMGHGTEHAANSAYQKLDDFLKESDNRNYFIGTVEASPSLDDVMAEVEKIGAKKVVLLPLMIVAGDHATNDMAGDHEESWKTKFKSEGYEVQCVLKGLGEYEGIRDLFAEHAGTAVDEMEEK